MMRWFSVEKIYPNFGSFLEWYDFSLYGYLAVIISHVFFGLGFFGGTAPAIATWLIHISGFRIMPAIYLSVAAFIAFCTILSIPERAHQLLD